MSETRWTTDTPGQPPRILTEPRVDEPLDDPDAWSNAALTPSMLPRCPTCGSTCLLCDGGALTDWSPDCEHVTRESIRERLRPEYPRYFVEDFQGEPRFGAGHDGVETPCEHATIPSAIGALLDALVEREVERLRPIQHRAQVAEDASAHPPIAYEPIPPSDGAVYEEWAKRLQAATYETVAMGPVEHDFTCGRCGVRHLVCVAFGSLHAHQCSCGRWSELQGASPTIKVT